MLRRVHPLIVLVLASLFQLTPAPLHAWSLTADGLRPQPLPAQGRPLTPPGAVDLKGDGRLETQELAHGQAQILSDGSVVWQSPSNWQVLQADFTDLNRDGRPELTLLVWRAFKTWPVDRWLPYGGRIQDFHDAAGRSCQLILIGWRGDAYGELWAGSALAEPVRQFAVLSPDGRAQALVTLDGSYASPSYAPAHALKVWTWNGFGFTVVSSVKGSFTHLVVLRDANGTDLIVTP